MVEVESTETVVRDMNAEIVCAMRRWAALAIEQEWADRWTPGAIFPREMAFLFACCEVSGITGIIESGRLDGFSTGLLADYGERCGADVVSLDLEIDADRAEQCRTRLRGHSRLTLLQGDSFTDLGPLLRDRRGGKLALVIDGPKKFGQLALLFAGAFSPAVGLLAAHNMNPGSPWRAVFHENAGDNGFYESLDLSSVPEWQRLTAMERDTSAGRAGNRDTKNSTLGVIIIANDFRQRIRKLRHPSFGWAQPARIAGLWSLGLYSMAGYLMKRIPT